MYNVNHIFFKQNHFHYKTTAALEIFFICKSSSFHRNGFHVRENRVQPRRHDGSPRHREAESGRRQRDEVPGSDRATGQSHPAIGCLRPITS